MFSGLTAILNAVTFIYLFPCRAAAYKVAANRNSVVAEYVSIRLYEVTFTAEAAFQFTKTFSGTGQAGKFSSASCSLIYDIFCYLKF